MQRLRSKATYPAAKQYPLPKDPEIFPIFRELHASDISARDYMYISTEMVRAADIDLFVPSRALATYMYTLMEDAMQLVEASTTSNSVDPTENVPSVLALPLSLIDETLYWEPIQKSGTKKPDLADVINRRAARMENVARALNEERSRRNYAQLAGPLSAVIRRTKPELSVTNSRGIGTLTQTGANCFVNAALFALFGSTYAYDALLLRPDAYTTHVLPMLEAANLHTRFKESLLPPRLATTENHVALADAREQIREWFVDVVVTPMRRGQQVEVTNRGFAAKILKCAEGLNKEVIDELIDSEFKDFARTGGTQSDTGDFLSSFLRVFAPQQRALYVTTKWQMKLKRPASIVAVEESGDAEYVQKLSVAHKHYTVRDKRLDLLTDIILEDAYALAHAEDALTPSGPVPALVSASQRAQVSAPLAFSVYVKRALYDENSGRQVRLGNAIHAPDTFTLGQLAGAADTDALYKYLKWPTSAGTQRYRLVAIAVHEGGTASGHYYTYARAPRDNRWWRVDPLRLTRARLREGASAEDRERNGVLWVYEAEGFNDAPENRKIFPVIDAFALQDADTEHPSSVPPVLAWMNYKVVDDD